MFTLLSGVCIYVLLGFSNWKNPILLHEFAYKIPYKNMNKEFPIMLHEIVDEDT